jgi:hypothetical protein
MMKKKYLEDKVLKEVCRKMVPYNGNGDIGHVKETVRGMKGHGMAHEGDENFERIKRGLIRGPGFVYVIAYGVLSKLEERVEGSQDKLNELSYAA